MCIWHQSDRHMRVCILHQSECRFCSLVWEVFKFQRISVGFVKWNHQLEWEMLLFCVFNMYFTTLYDKCNSTGWMKDISLPIVNVFLMLWKWWMVVQKKMEFCALYVAWSWLLFLHNESKWKNFQSNIACGVHELQQTFWFSAVL